MRYFLLIIFLAAGIKNFAQAVPDSSAQFKKDSLAIMRVKLVRPQFKFDNRVAFYEKQALSITGFDVGVLLSDKLRFTLGYYRMNERLKFYDELKEGAEFGRFIKMNYGSINTELIYKDTRFFSLGMPLEISVGVNSFQNKNITTDEVISSESGGLMFVNFGMSGTFKPMRFLGLKGSIGYRKTVFNQVEDFKFDGFSTSIGLNIDIHAVVTDIQMYRLQKKYHRGNNLANAVNVITD
jgi:hypothetical protein